MLVGCRFLFATFATSDTLADPVQFERDVRPILSTNCFPCHGPDSNKREADLRLDSYESAIELRDGFGAIDPDNLADSELLRRIFHEDPDEQMPPHEEAKQLSDAQKKILNQWVKAGAKYEKHWAWITPRKPAVPKSSSDNSNLTPIDHFIRRALDDRGLQPTPRASGETLIRRLSLDLTGLPPEPSDVKAFVDDTRPNAYGLLVDRLLASKHYGERMALAWMDVARYADTSGLNADGVRQMWPWRDWVIRAYNQNMPFDEFLRDQLAGDLLPHPTREQFIATGFNRNNVTSDENGAIPEELRVQYAVDRLKTTFNVFQALSVECAQCHDHKYDPISQEEYYGLFAFFNNTSDPGMQTRKGNQAPLIPIETDESKAQVDELETQISQHQEKLSQLTLGEDEFDLWLNQIIAKLPVLPVASRWQRIGNFSGGTLRDVFNNEQIPIPAGQPDFNERHASFGWKPVSDWRDGEPKRLLMHKASSAYYYRELKVEMPTALTLSLSGLDGAKVWLNDQKVLEKKGEQETVHDVCLALSTGTNHLLVKIGSMDDGSFNLTFGFDQPLLSQRIHELLTKNTYTDSDLNRLKEFYRDRVWPESNALRKSIAELRSEQLKIITTGISSMIMQERMDRRPTFILKRGLYDSPDESQEIEPGTPEFLHALDRDAPRNRLGLAEWMIDKRNPLTARVAVNRYWALLFGRGLVDSEMDFGNQGSNLSHPELLDWLATTFIESGWNVKGMIKTIVMSATYQQSSAISEDHKAADPENRWLARGPRFRLQAEFIRDLALANGRLLNKKIGGPSIKPYQPEGLWAEVSDGGKLYYKHDSGDKLYRRGMYVYWKRAAPHPAFLALDTPVREKCLVIRQNSNTPLQALVLLNELTFVEASRHLAARLILEGGNSFKGRVNLGFQLCISRDALPEEIKVCQEVYTKQLNSFRSQPNRAHSLLSQGESENPAGLDTVEHAVWTVIASLLLNLDETLTRG